MSAPRHLRYLLPVLIALAGCGGDEPIAPLTTTGTGAAAATTTHRAPPPAADTGHGPAEDAQQDPRRTALERAAESTVREYVAALDARDGERVCAVLAPGVIAQVDLPVERGDPCASLGASIGYRDPRGLPVWASAKLVRIRSLEIAGDSAKVVVTVETKFADRAEVSIEDDIVFLGHATGRWLVAKPSATFYRAIGVADVPPSVLSPPSG